MRFPKGHGVFEVFIAVQGIDATLVMANVITGEVLEATPLFFEDEAALNAYVEQVKLPIKRNTKNNHC